MDLHHRMRQQNSKLASNILRYEDTEMTKRFRDYSQPLVPIFEGETDRRTFLQMMNSPKRVYDYKEESRKVAEKLREQGFKL